MAISVDKLKQEEFTTFRFPRKDKDWWVREDYEDVLNELFSNWYALTKLQGTLF